VSGAKSKCMRCFIDRPAVTTGQLTYEGYRYELDLCEQHARMFDTDMQNWIRLARDCGPEIKERVENPVIPFPVTDGGVEFLDERKDSPDEEITLEAMAFTFTEHALHQMRWRKIDKADVWRALSTKNKTVTISEKNMNCLVHRTEDMKVVINPMFKRVVTVMWRHEEELEKKRSGS